MDTNLQLVSYVPKRQLMPFIDYYWIAKTKEGQIINRMVNVLPIAMHTLIFFLGDQPLRISQENDGILMPEICMIGMVIQNDQYLLRGNMHFIAVRFKPLGLYRFFNVSPSECVNQNLDFGLYGKELCCLYYRLHEGGDYNHVINSLDKFFLKKLSEGQRKNRKIELIGHSINRIYHKNGNVMINDLYRSMRLSERGFRKLFIQTVGISPKLYSRITRFNYVFSQMMSQERSTDLFDIIEQAGYYDQPHFLKEFKSFTGSSFTQFRSNFIEFDELHRGEG